MRYRMLILSGMFAAVSTVASSEAIYAEDSVRMIHPETKVHAPGIDSLTVNGDKFIFSEIKGQVILLNFWATWCIPCRKELPSLEKLQAKFQDKRFSVIGIAVDKNRKAVMSILKKGDIRFLNILDPDEIISQKYEINMLPTTYLIGKDGKFIGKFIGERNWDDNSFKDLIQRELDK